MKISKKLEALFIFLSEQEREGSLFSRDDILTATGWKPATFKTYWTKGQLSDLVMTPTY